MKRRTMCWMIWGGVILAGAGAFTQVRDPLFKIHDRGLLWETVKDNGQIGGVFSPFEFYPSMDWPGGSDVLPSKDEQRSYSQGSGVWIGGKNPDGSVFFNEMGPFTYVDHGSFDTITEETNFIGSPDFDPNQAEEIITASWLTTTGIRIRRTSLSWSYPNYTDFIIFEYILENQSSGVLSDVYFATPSLIRPSYQDILVHGFWGDNLNVDDELVGYDSTRNLIYVYDYYPNQSIAWDWGNYVADRNELRTTGYAGIALLDCDSAKNSSPQPAHHLYAQTINNTQHMTISSQNEEDMYALLTGADTSLQAPRGEVLSPLLFESIGPYDLAPGDSVRIVLVTSVNGLPQEQAVKGLSAQSLLPAGLDSLKAAVDRARELCQDQYVPKVLAPPSPNITLYVLPSTQEIVVVWPPEYDEWVDPLTGEMDFNMYRVYRSDRSFIGPFQKIREIKPTKTSDRDRYFDIDLNEWKYKDNTVQVGVGYYYMVTSVDAAGNESGWTNRNTTALVTAREPALDALNVSVFPNPFRLVSGLPTAGEESSIVFTNLPALCTIRIYTISGDLVRTLEHDNTASGEEVWNQLTDSRQKTAAGIYLYTVESDVGNAKGTLVLIK